MRQRIGDPVPQLEHVHIIVALFMIFDCFYVFGLALMYVSVESVFATIFPVSSWITVPSAIDTVLPLFMIFASDINVPAVPGRMKFIFISMVA